MRLPRTIARRTVLNNLHPLTSYDRLCGFIKVFRQHRISLRMVVNYSFYEERIFN